MDEPKRKLILRTMLLLSLIGLAVTSYQTYEHYFLTSSICDFTESFSCSSVTESRFGEFPPNSGISTAGWGIPWWGLLALLVLGIIRGKRWFKAHEFYTFVWLIIGALFAIYLIIIEVYILPMEIGEVVVCPLCTVQHVMIAALLVMGFAMLKKPVKGYLEEIFFVAR